MALTNSGQQGWTTLEGYFTDGNTPTLTGQIMPNIMMISPQAIVPSSATITYNQAAVVAPTGGADGDIWYNEPNDALYKKIAGVWTFLTDRVINQYYQAPITNLTDCPI